MLYTINYLIYLLHHNTQILLVVFDLSYYKESSNIEDEDNQLKLNVFVLFLDLHIIHMQIANLYQLQYNFIQY